VIIINTEIITFGRMITMAGMTEGEIATMLGEEDGIGIGDLTTATIGIIRFVIHTRLTMIDGIMTDRTLADIRGGIVSAIKRN
jgi:hypothetical protein